MAWDTTLTKTKNKEQIAHIILTKFQCGDTPAGIKFTIGGMYVPEYVRRVSENALEEIKKCKSSCIVENMGVRYASVKPKKMGVTFEHMIPIKSVYDHFEKLFNEGLLTEEYILQVIDKFELAIITKKENSKFSKVNPKLTQSMPQGWWDTKKKDPLARYREAGLNDEIWAKI